MKRAFIVGALILAASLAFAQNATLYEYSSETPPELRPDLLEVSLHDYCGTSDEQHVPGLWLACRRDFRVVWLCDPDMPWRQCYDRVMSFGAVTVYKERIEAWKRINAEKIRIIETLEGRIESWKLIVDDKNRQIAECGAK